MFAIAMLRIEVAVVYKPKRRKLKMKKNTNKTLNVLRRLAIATTLATILGVSPATTIYAQTTASALSISMVNTSYNNKAEQASYKLIVDGVNKTSEVTFKVQNNRSMIGLRQFSNALGATVDWDNRKIAIVKKGSTTIEVPIGSKEVIVNGNKKSIDTQGTVSIIVDSLTYLPFRVVAENLGYTVSYDQNTKTITCTSSQPQPPQLQIENKYNVTVPQGMENTTWLPQYNYFRDKYGMTDEQAKQNLAQCKLAPAWISDSNNKGVTYIMSEAQCNHFDSIDRERVLAVRAGTQDKMPTTPGKFKGEMRGAWIFDEAGWTVSIRAYCGLNNYSN